MPQDTPTAITARQCTECPSDTFLSWYIFRNGYSYILVSECVVCGYLDADHMGNRADYLRD